MPLTDYPADYDFRSGALRFPSENLAPSLGPLRLLASGTSFDTQRSELHVQVTILNTGSVPVVGPDGIAVFAFDPGTVQPSGAVCDPPDAALPVLPAGACLFDHRGTNGVDGLLGPGESSRPVEWTLLVPGRTSFSLRARTVRGGLAGPGEIQGIVYEDRDGDAARDDAEPGLAGETVQLDGAHGAQEAHTDSSGAFAFQVDAPGTYDVRYVSPGRCASGTARHAVHIVSRSGGGLSGYGRADFGAIPGSGGAPSVRFLDVRGLGAGAPPCSVAEPCTIPAGWFRIRFEVVPRCAPIAGVQWEAAWRHETVSVPPDAGDSLFIPARDSVVFCRLDSFPFDCPGDTLWSALRGVISVNLRAPRSYVDNGSGSFLFRARVQDRSGLTSPFESWRLILNYDPDTEIQRLPSCDCPSPPSGCATRGPRPVGWITGVGNARFDVSQWIPFCAGDTIPQGSTVRFFARGRDDPRDGPLDPGGAVREPTGSFRDIWTCAGESSTSMPFCAPYATEDAPLPDGSSWHGASVEWRPGPFDHTFFAAAVDERGRLDGTPDSISFFVSGAPVIDSLGVPPVIVLVPNCAWHPTLCRDPGSFGRDTLAIVGRWTPDLAVPPATSMRLGYNEFVIPLRAWGHDHPRDANPAWRYERGRIRAWKFSFDCTDAGRQDWRVPGEDGWLEQLQGEWPEQAWTDSLRFTAPLDTLCRVAGCSGALPVIVLVTTRLGRYELEIQGRDTAPSDWWNWEAFDLSRYYGGYRRQIGDLGRVTQVVKRNVTLRQLADVRGPSAARAQRALTAP